MKLDEKHDTLQHHPISVSGTKGLPIRLSERFFCGRIGYHSKMVS